jgi:hypothetical protein
MIKNNFTDATFYFTEGNIDRLSDFGPVVLGRRTDQRLACMLLHVLLPDVFHQLMIAGVVA